MAPHEFAVTSAGKVQIYDPNTNTVKRQLVRFNNDGEVFSGSFRYVLAVTEGWVAQGSVFVLLALQTRELSQALVPDLTRNKDLQPWRSFVKEGVLKADLFLEVQLS